MGGLGAPPLAPAWARAARPSPCPRRPARPPPPTALLHPHPHPPRLPCCSQQEHLYEAHPYRPFPTDALEAAVAAVPLEAYPERERKLAQFGREFVFCRTPWPPPQLQQAQRAQHAQRAGAQQGEGGPGAARRPFGGGRRLREVGAAAQRAAWTARGSPAARRR